jgi:putative transposase
VRKTFKYRLYPSAAQQELLRGQLSEACRLYNAALQERRDAYKSHRKSLNYYDQANQLKEIRAAGDLRLANYHCCQDVLKRVDKAFQAFFRRVKTGDKAGYPRFKSHRRYDSITFPSHGDGNKLLEKHLRMQGVGEVKIKLHRPVDGKIKTVTVMREGNHWYACFSCEVSAQPLPESTNQVGIDVGVKSFAALSTGEIVDNPRHFTKAEKRLRRAQRRVSRRKKYSKRWGKAVQFVVNIHREISNQRRDFQHKLSREIVDHNGFIAVEDLNVKGLAGGMLAKSVADVGWSSFLNMLSYKAESAGRKFVMVDPRGTSQRCPCGRPARKKLSDRAHVCKCGLRTTRDHASSLEILRLGLSLQDITKPDVRVCVS